MANGIRSLDNIALQTAVSRQYDFGYKRLADENFYLFENDIEKLMQESVEMISGWLYDILIARIDFDSSRLEYLRDRREVTHVLPNLTTVEMRSYLD